jgi:hypothetical protein
MTPAREPSSLLRAGRVAVVLLCLALVAAAVVTARILIFEFFHADAATSAISSTASSADAMSRGSST